MVGEVAPLVEVFKRHHPTIDEAPLYRAYAIARLQHAGQIRKSGEPYVTHPLAVAMALADYGMDRDTLVAALLHDTVEDTPLTIEEIELEFGGRSLI